MSLPPRCHIHGINSFEKQRKQEDFVVIDTHCGGLKCRRCKQLTCNVCITNFITLTNTKLQKIKSILLEEQIFKDMIAFSKNYDQGVCKVCNFTKQGPCCSILKVRTDDINDIEFDFDKSNVYNVESVTSDNDITHVTTTDKEGTKERLHPERSHRKHLMRHEIRQCDKQEAIDGALHIPQHHVLVHLPIGHPSTHAMGDQQKYNEVGLMHGCVDAETASQISSEEFKNTEKKQKLSDSMVLPQLLMILMAIP